MRPCSSMIRSMPATIEASSVTSIANVWTPRSDREAIRSTRRATAYTTKPLASRARAVLSPMPDEPPVTRATGEVMERS